MDRRLDVQKAASLWGRGGGDLYDLDDLYKIGSVQVSFSVADTAVT